MKAAWTWTLALALITASGPASAQCTMMGGGGHDHGDRLTPSSQKLSGSQKKQRQSIDRLLNDDEGRRLLAGALLSDPRFIRDFMARLMAIPEWRALAIQHAARDSSGRGFVDPGAGIRGEALYVCPMHPEVTSPDPGECPRCGMRLERETPNHR